MSGRKYPERDLQIAAVQYIRAAYPGLIFFFCPNGGNLSKVQRAMFQKMGLTPGVPDLHFLLPNGRAAYMEMKAPGGSLSPEQKAFRDAAMLGCGALWAVAKSIEDVERILAEWLAPFNWTPRARVTA